MQNPFVCRAGGVLSADIAVPEHDRELAFYSKILTTGDNALWRDDLLNNLGIPVIGLGARTPEYESLPLQWMPHFQVDNVAASAECAVEMGGKQLMHSKTDDGESQWAVLVDQDGAAFGVIPVVTQPSENKPQETRQGCIAWLSLTVPNSLASRDFYQRVVGWNAQPIEDCEEPNVKFEMQIDAETAAAEICQVQNVPNSIPSTWLIHLPVDDLAESLRLVSDGGGKVIKEPTEGQDAIVRDPVGVFLALRSSL